MENSKSKTISVPSAKKISPTVAGKKPLVSRLLFILMLALLWSGVNFLAYDLGRTEGRQAQHSAIIQIRDIRANVLALNVAIADAWLEIEKSQADNLLEKNFHDSTRQHISVLEQTISQHKNQINLYRRILAPTTTDTGIRIERIDLIVADARSPEINLVLSQIKPDPKIITGEVQVNLSGQKDGKDITLPLSKVASFNNNNDYPMQFKLKHLQEFPAVLNLPSGFKLNTIDVIVSLNRPDGQRITRRTFKWSQLQG